MDKEIRRLLDEEIKESLEELSTFDSGSSDKTSAIDDLTKLYKLKLEDAKLEAEVIEKNRAFESDRLLNDVQVRNQAKDQYIRMGVEAAGIVLPLIFYAVWMNKGFKFEETGTFTSTTFRGLFSRFKTTKK